MSFERYNAGLANEIKNADFENESEIVNFVRSKLYRLWNVEQSKIKKLEKQNKILKEALSFYSKKENWTIDGHNFHDEKEELLLGEFAATIRNDCDESNPANWHGTYGGKRARQALKKCKETND